MIKYLYQFFSILPITTSQRLAVFIGSLFYWFDNREKHIADTNIRLCFPELSRDNQKKLLKNTLVENVKTLLEMPRIFHKGGSYAIRLISKTSGLYHYEKAIAEGRGVILLAPHLGNWELTVHYLNQFSPITAMFAPPKQAFLYDLMKKGRQSSGATLVPADATGVRAQLKHLKKGGVVGILPDQKPKSGHAGVYAPFMGQKAYTMLLVNSLAKRTDATILLTFAERLATGKGYHLHIIPAPAGMDGDNEIDAAIALNQGIEQCVRLAPSQYQWTYKRFTQSSNKPPLY